MRLPFPIPFPFLVIPNRHSLHHRFFASNAVSGPASPPPRLPYFVPRNSRGSLPVYSDVHNNGTQYLISVRNVEGNIKALSGDLLRDLCDPTSPESTLIKARITRSNHLVLTGLRRKHAVLDWLVHHGF
ncbi:hypothetical protein B0F90DRAFT_1623749 [Multifurca ochricompacta]|uniref:Large ribosomal subunit protein mL49 n=1 Tax=Multifurca ochricompacta TaxID=376703 RepID=A0AAD4MAH1_9AGAM|nr:hypothetical protein B0F90DRAFT_1623749 [Multifurca ochricompacta]